MVGVILALVMTLFAGVVIFKRYKPQLILFFSGMVLMALSIVLETGTFIKAGKSTGFIWFDIFESIRLTFSSQIANIGLIILVVGAFATYMEHIGASRALVRIMIKPLQMLRAPYLVLALTYVVGQHINIVVPSAAGLGLLLMATLYPTLIRLGVHPLAACSVIATTPCLDLGPASGMSNVAAETAGISGAVYFVDYQLHIMYPVIAVIAILHYIVQKYLDKKDGIVAGDPKILEELAAKADESGPQAPTFYALLPLVPLVLVFVFSPLMISAIKMNIITAIFITTAFTVVLEMVRHWQVKPGYDGFDFFLKQMGPLMNVVTIMVAASVFATGLKAIGAIDTLIEAGKTAGMGPAGMIIILTSIVGLASALTGSGNAAFLSFAVLAPQIATDLNFDPMLLLMPMQLAAGMCRSISPVSGVVIACSGLAGQSPMAVSRRTAIPMLGGTITLIATTIMFWL